MKEIKPFETLNRSRLLPTAVALLEEDGVLVSDNVLFDGEIIESRFAVTRRNRTIHKRMRDYLYTLTQTG